MYSIHISYSNAPLDQRLVLFGEQMQLRVLRIERGHGHVVRVDARAVQRHARPRALLVRVNGINIDLYVHIYIHTPYIQTHTYIYIYKFMYSCMYVCIHIHTHIAYNPRLTQTRMSF